MIDIFHYCSDYYPAQWLAVCTREEPVRVNGITREEYAEGIVQVCVNDRWGLVCDDGWNNHSAMVVCKQLGYTTGGELDLFNSL